MWIGGRVAVRGEGSGVLHEGLIRYLATLFLEKQFGREAVQSELYRERLAYSTVAQRDAPLAKANQLDNTYFNSVPNRGAMVWRLIERAMGRDVLLSFLREQATKSPNGVTLASIRAALNDKGGEALKSLLDQQLDQVIDTDLMVGLPQQRGAEWVSALRNLGSLDVTVPVVATTDRGEVITSQATIPAKNFSEVVFKTTGRIVRVEVDPEKLYPQTSYGNDVVPHTKDLNDALNDVAAQLGAQDFAKAEATARELLAAAPRLQEARILLARAMLGANKLDEAEKLFQASLNEPLPFTATLAWANIGLGEINMKRNQPVEAAKRFNEAVIASRDYPSSLAARAARIRAEAAANSAPPVDESARTFLTQFGQAVITNKRADLEARVVPGELVKFVNGTIGTDIWETRVVRTEELSGGVLAADVTVRLRKLGTEGNGTAVFLLSRVAGGWKLSGIDLFEVK
jgi:tetratricopeptide (TPR) repeat protein